MFSRLTQFTLLAALAIPSGAAFADQQKSREVPVSISEAYVPASFNKGLDVIIIASGVYPNGCYRWSRTEVKHPSERVHDVTAYANVQQGMCLMVLVPFNKEVDLGRLTPGEHKVRFVNADGTFMEKTIKVE